MGRAVILTPDPGAKDLHRPSAGHPIAQFRLAFIDDDDAQAAAEVIQAGRDEDDVTRVIFESPTMYESVRPFLEALKAADPHRLPFRRYIKNSKNDAANLSLPAYARKPGFMWDLSSYLKPDAKVHICNMDPKSEESIACARDILYEHGKLDSR
jgi:hypothetical protein